MRLIGEQKGHGGKSHGWKGKGKGKGKQDGPADVNSLPQGRRLELRTQVEEFVAKAERQLAFPSSISGLERKYLHEVAEEFGLTSQSFGQGKDRCLSLFKPDVQASSGAVTQPEAAAVDDAIAQVDDSDVQYSCIVLDRASRAKLEEFAQIPSDWTPHCDHMTICVGSLRRPLTEDNRSVAGNLKDQIAGFRDRQAFQLTVVSRGTTSTVMAVGVVGCPSCNRNPHITVGTAPKIAPNASNTIPKWEMLPHEEQFTLEGMVWQRGGKRPQFPPGTEPVDADVEYSCLVLDKASQDALLAWQQSAYPTINDAKIDHVKICSGSLVGPSGPVAVRNKISKLEQGQECAVRVLDGSMCKGGERGQTNLLAIRVEVGSGDAFQVEHDLTPSVEEEGKGKGKGKSRGKKTQPQEEEKATREWTPLAEQLNLRGMVWQRGGNRPDHPAAWRWKVATSTRHGDLDSAGLAKSIATEACRGYLASIASGGLPCTKGTLEALLLRRGFLRPRLYVYHPYGLAMCLADKVNQRDVLRFVERWVQPPVLDPNGLFLGGPRAEAIPADDVQKVAQKLSACTSCDSAAYQAIWIASQAFCTVRVPVEAVLADLQDNNLVKIAADGKLAWSVAAMKACGSSNTGSPLPYRSAWPVLKARNEAEDKAAARARMEEAEARNAARDGNRGSDDDDDDDD